MCSHHGSAGRIVCNSAEDIGLRKFLVSLVQLLLTGESHGLNGQLSSNSLGVIRIGLNVGQQAQSTWIHSSE